MRRVARPAGAAVVIEIEMSLGQQSFTSECLQIRNARADNIYVGADGATLGRVMRDCTQQGYTGIMTGNALALVDRNKSEPTFNNRFVAASFIFPWIKNSLPAERAYQAAARRYAPGTILSGAAAGAWTSGKMLEAAVGAVADKARQGPITRALILEGLYKLRNETLGGLTAPWTYRPGKTAPDQPCYSLIAIVNGQWAAPIKGGNNFRCYRL
jgi:branched-chain amino acid transport system substrate-binding protein